MKRYPGSFPMVIPKIMSMELTKLLITIPFWKIHFHQLSQKQSSIFEIFKYYIFTRIFNIFEQCMKREITQDIFLVLVVTHQLDLMTFVGWKTLISILKPQVVPQNIYKLQYHREMKFFSDELSYHGILLRDLDLEHQQNRAQNVSNPHSLKKT